MDEWQPARLIPTSGITGPEEAERRATSALLAVMSAVKEFGAAMTRLLDAPSGTLSTFIEVSFSLSDGRRVVPDGALNVTRGQTSWTCLVEVKTGNGQLTTEQVESYLDAAKEHNCDAVLTISNDMAPAAGVHPVQVDRRKLRKVSLHHLSWTEILTLALQIRVHRGVSDPDQAWVLGELIRYLEHPKSGAMDFDDMGPTWVSVRDAVVSGTARPSDDGVADVASRWDQLLRFTALRLGRELGADVQVVVPRKELADPALRLGRFSDELASLATLSGTIRIPDSIGSLKIDADLRAGRVTVSVEVDAPKEGRPMTRVNWLCRQLIEAPEGLRIDGLFSGTSTTTSELLATIRENPGLLVDGQQRELRGFRIAATTPLGAKRSTGRGSFIDSVLTAIDGFYECVVQGFRPWVPKAPKLPASGRSAAEDAGLAITPPADEVESDEVGLTAGNEDDTDLRDDLAAAVAERSEHTEIDWAAATPPPFVPDEMVSWRSAESRLERERSAAQDARDW